MISSQEKFKEIVDFITENRGEWCFRKQNEEDIKEYVLSALCTDMLIIHRNRDGNINGIMTWEVIKYIPLSIEVTECIAKGKGVLLHMLQEFKSLLPISFNCFAQRGNKKVQYTPRILSLLKGK